MTKDELKNKLKSSWAISKQIESRYEELQHLKDNAVRITPAYSLAPGSGSGQKQESAIIRIVDMEMAINDDIANLVAALQEVRALVALVDDDIPRLVLHKRYLCYQKWEQIAADLNYSWQWIHKMHGRALREILQKTSD